MRQGFDSNEVSPHSYELLAYPVAPGILLEPAKRRLDLFKRLKIILRRSGSGLQNTFVYVGSHLGPLPLTLLRVLAILASVLMLPVALLGMALFAVWRTLMRQLALLRDRLNTSGWWRGPSQALMARIVDAAFDLEAQRLGKRIQRNSEIASIFVPFSFIGKPLNVIRKPKVIVFPDAVHGVFPTRYYGHVNDQVTGRIRDSIDIADEIICYSKHVAVSQLLHFFGEQAADKPIQVIPQGFFHELAVPDCDDDRKLRFVNRFPEWCSYLPSYELREVPYIVYPSVDRPHKNFMTLLRAVELLIRRHHVNIKLVTTSHAVNPDCANFIVRNRLFMDILYAPELNQADLAFLIRNARLVVHASLAEGGDIFNFSRGVVSDVPVLMSDIPVVREMFERWNIPESTFASWLFPATDSEALALAIKKALVDRSALLEQQREAYKQLSKYDYKAMAAAYYDVVSNARLHR